MSWVPSGIVTLLTDFGDSDTFVGIMKGVILGIAPAARLVDLTHAVPAQNIEVGAQLLRSAVEYFPTGTVHLAVVDPGVGSTRSPIAVVTERGILVGPDNGVLHPSAMSLGVREIRRLDRDQFFRTFVSRTFHGRDVFAPVAAHLAAGRTPQELGPTLDEMQAAALQEARFDGKRISGRVIHVDGFGNLMTNIPAALFDRLPAGSGVRVGGKSIGPLRGSYAEAAEGELLLVISSWGTLEIAERGGDAARTLSLGRGAAVIAAAE